MQQKPTSSFTSKIVCATVLNYTCMYLHFSMNINTVCVDLCSTIQSRIARKSTHD